MYPIRPQSVHPSPVPSYPSIHSSLSTQCIEEVGKVIIHGFGEKHARRDKKGIIKQRIQPMENHAQEQKHFQCADHDDNNDTCLIRHPQLISRSTTKRGTPRKCMPHQFSFISLPHEPAHSLRHRAGSLRRRCPPSWSWRNRGAVDTTCCKPGAWTRS